MSQRLFECLEDVENAMDEVGKISNEDTAETLAKQRFFELVERVDGALKGRVGPHRLGQDPVVDCGIAWDHAHVEEYESSCAFGVVSDAEYGVCSEVACGRSFVHPCFDSYRRVL